MSLEMTLRERLISRPHWTKHFSDQRDTLTDTRTRVLNQPRTAHLPEAQLIINVNQSND